MRAAVVISALLLASCASGGAATSSAGAGGSSSSSSAASSSSGSAGGATGACTACGEACVDVANDPLHCGSCDRACPKAKPFCDRGECAVPPCTVMGPICPLDHVCCGDACCPPWKMCCNLPGASQPACIDADAGACPTACSGCQ